MEHLLNRRCYLAEEAIAHPFLFLFGSDITITIKFILTLTQTAPIVTISFSQSPMVVIFPCRPGRTPWYPTSPLGPRCPLSSPGRSGAVDDELGKYFSFFFF